jgi:hypothetical protein
LCSGPLGRQSPLSSCEGEVGRTRRPCTPIFPGWAAVSVTQAGLYPSPVPFGNDFVVPGAARAATAVRRAR